MSWEYNSAIADVHGTVVAGQLCNGLRTLKAVPGGSAALLIRKFTLLTPDGHSPIMAIRVWRSVTLASNGKSRQETTLAGEGRRAFNMEKVG